MPRNKDNLDHISDQSTQNTTMSGVRYAQDQSPLIHTVNVQKVPASGKDIKVTLTADEQEKIAQFLELNALNNTTLTARLEPAEKGLLRLQGNLTAVYGYTSALSLEPFEETQTIPIDVIFAPEKHKIHQRNEDEGDASVGNDIVEPIINHEIDLGAVIVEHLALEQKFNPLKPDENWDDLATLAGNTEETNPFAVLKEALRGKSKAP